MKTFCKSLYIVMYGRGEGENENFVD